MANLGYIEGDFPKAEKYYSRAITVPLFPGMSHEFGGKVWERVRGGSGGEEEGGPGGGRRLQETKTGT